MTQFRLSRRTRQALEALVVHTDQAIVLRRAQALLRVAEGLSITQVARQLRVTRQAVYKWIARIPQAPISELAVRLQARPRSGRPTTVAGIIDPLVDEVIDHDPRLFDFNSTVWTASLLAQYLAAEHGLEVSVSSVRLALGRLKITWKRPRHTLALRSATWRQAKGGLKRGWQAESAPSF
jgi:transposase